MKKKDIMEVFAHNNALGDIHKGSPQKCTICHYDAEDYFKKEIQCQMICGDGSGKIITKHFVNCPNVS